MELTPHRIDAMIPLRVPFALELHWASPLLYLKQESKTLILFVEYLCQGEDFEAVEAQIYCKPPPAQMLM